MRAARPRADEELALVERSHAKWNFRRVVQQIRASEAQRTISQDQGKRGCIGVVVEGHGGRSLQGQVERREHELAFKNDTVCMGGFKVEVQQNLVGDVDTGFGKL